MKLLESREHVRTEVNTASVGSDNETRDTQISAGERRASKNHLKALITTLEKGLSSSVSLIRHIGTLFVPLGIPWTAIIGQLGYIFIRRETETIAMGYAHSCPNNRMHGTHCT